MAKVFKFTKFKLVTGYLVVLLLAVVAIVFVFRETLLLTSPNNSDHTTQEKRVLITQTLSKLTEAEQLNIAFTDNVTRSQFNNYVSLIDEVKQNMDSLTRLSHDSIQHIRINLVKLLLNEKISNLHILMKIRQSDLPGDFYKRAIETLETIRDTNDHIQVKERVVQKSDTSIVDKRSGWARFWGRKKDIEEVVTVTEEHLFDTIPKQNIGADTLINAITHVFNEYKDEKLLHDRQTLQKEMAIIRDGQRINEEINQILNSIEEEEFEYALKQLEDRQEATRQLTQSIAFIAIITTLLAAFFIFLVIRDISRSQRYRKELEEANQLAEKLLKARERLMLTVSHDIKSPLNSITGYIELLTGTELSERQRYYLENMKGSAQHILRLVNNLLDYSKLESGKMNFDAIHYNPAKLLQETVDSFIPQAGQKELKLESHISKALNDDFIGDPLKVRQIVVNLLSNAVKYTRSGKIDLSAFISGTRDKKNLSLVIRDTGAGMTSEEQQLIFEEFTRLSQEHNNGAEGTGLGLTITRQMIELMGGNISLESTKGIGSAFTVRLPLKVATATAPQTLPPQKEELTVLLIDDDPLQLSMCSEFLRREGIRIIASESSTQALDLLQQEPIELVISDIQMPEMDGFALIRHIRSLPDESLRSLPVIALSARDDLSEKEYTQCGFSAYVNKPFTPAQLSAAITRLTGYVIEESSAREKKNIHKESSYNLEAIRVFADDDPAALAQIITSFTTDCQRNFNELEQLLQQQDLSAISRLAHKMLPMWKQFAIHDIVPLLSYLEKTELSTCPAEELATIIQQIIREGNVIIEEINEEIKNQ